MYRGRFAPSPTGPLHFGSLVAAAASYLDARAREGMWLVRIEDLDPARNQPGAADQILRTLEGFGFTWDGPVLYQSSRIEAYREALDRLRGAGAAFPCSCSRKEAAEGAGCRCRDGLPPGEAVRAWRARVDAAPVEYQDRHYGSQSESLEETCGNFVLLRADGIFSYQLAVVADDAFQGVTDVVRGDDLLDSTARQIWLQRKLGVPTPSYLHFPVVRDENGHKLSKQTRAPAIARDNPGRELCGALRYLGYDPPGSLESAPPAELWSWALAAARVGRGGFSRLDRPTRQEESKADEVALVEAVLRKDRKATAEFVDRYTGPVYSYVRSRVVPRVDLADDLTQDVFLAAWENLERWSRKAPLLPWLLGIARHKIEDHYRARLREPLGLEDTHEPAFESALSLDQRMDRAKLEERIREVFSGMAPAYSAVLMWRYWEKRSAREIASQTGRSEKAVERLLARAREQFRRRWSDG